MVDAAAATPAAAASPVRLRLLGAPAMVAPRALAFLPERRFRLAAMLALSPLGLTRDEVAAVFWPDRGQAAARSNLRKLILELRRLDLPAIQLDGNRLTWAVASDALDLLEGREPAPDWAEPLPGLGGSDSSAFDDWLLATRERLHDAWQAMQTARPAGRRHDDVAGDEPELVGRADELAQLQSLLREPRCRLLTVLGPGGVGKSALALALLRHGTALDADGLHWIALEDLQDLAQLPLRLARELGVKVGPLSDGWDASLAALQGRRALLILDNAEHLAGLPARVAPLLAKLPLLRLLVTSRHRLGLPEERVMRLAPLMPAAAQRLFVGQARRAPARHPIDPADPAVAALTDLLGGLPLALRLAATWTRHLRPVTLVQQLRQSIDLLHAQEPVDEHPGHHSLQACLEHSWALLGADRQRALAALAAPSATGGAMRLDVAAATAGVTSAALAALADASLIDIDAADRVALHPLIRRFCRDRLDAEALQQARARHAEAVVSLMLPFQEFDDIDVSQALTVIAPERQQIELAWLTAIEQRRAEWLRDLAGPLSNLVQAEGGLDVVLPLFARAQLWLVLARQADRAALCNVALEHATLHFWRGDNVACEAAALVALGAAKASHQQRRRRQALNALALVAMRQSRFERAARLMEGALNQARRSDTSVREVAIFAGNLSGIRRELGDLQAARELAEESLQAHRTQGSAIGETALLNELALIAHHQGRLDEAFEYSRLSLEVTEQHAMVMRRPAMLTHQAWIRLDQGRLAEAQALVDRSMDELRQGNARHYHEPSLRRVMAELALKKGDAPSARQHLRLACERCSPLADEINSRGLLWSLAMLARFEGDSMLAATLGRRAERSRPPRAVPVQRYLALRAELPPAAHPAPDDDELQRRIDQLLG